MRRKYVMATATVRPRRRAERAYRSVTNEVGGGLGPRRVDCGRATPSRRSMSTHATPRSLEFESSRVDTPVRPTGQDAVQRGGGADDPT
nr:unnamed protein product [Digitaria exilis]